MLSPSLPQSVYDLYSYDAVLIYAGWMAFHVIMERVLPGESRRGEKREEGKSREEREEKKTGIERRERI